MTQVITEATKLYAIRDRAYRRRFRRFARFFDNPQQMKSKAREWAGNTKVQSTAAAAAVLLIGPRVLVVSLTV